MAKVRVIDDGTKKKNFIFASKSLSSALYILVGLVMVLLPSITNKLIGIIIGAFITIIGAIKLYNYYKVRDNKYLSSGIVISAIGILILFIPNIIADFIATCIGVYLSIIGITRIISSLKIKKSDVKSWLYFLIEGILLLLFGLYCFTNPLSSYTITKTAGIFLLIMGTINIIDSIILNNK